MKTLRALFWLARPEQYRWVVQPKSVFLAYSPREARAAAVPQIIRAVEALAPLTRRPVLWGLSCFFVGMWLGATQRFSELFIDGGRRTVSALVDVVVFVLLAVLSPLLVPACALWFSARPLVRERRRLATAVTGWSSTWETMRPLSDETLDP